MNNQQQFIYDKLKEAVALTSAQRPVGVHEIIEPISRYLITLLSLHEGYSALDEDAMKDLEQRYYESPQYNIAVLLQMINILDMTERTATRETEHERTVPNL